MAGARIVIEADLGAASDGLGELIAQLEGDGRRRLLQDIGEYELRATRERAADEVDPDGHRWRELEPAYKRRKAKLRPGAPILKYDFHMLGDQLSWQIDGDDLLVGTNAVYGATQHFTYDRPWLGISDEDEQEILEILVTHLRAAASGDSGPAA